MNIVEQPINGLVESEPNVPTKRGDIIACGVYDGSNSLSVCWVDFVSDELLYAISKGAKGWSTARSNPKEFTDAQKQAQLRLLQHYVYAKIVCAIDGVNGGKS